MEQAVRFDDGCVQLTVDALRDIELVHLISGLDEATPPLSGDGATTTEITGYTEWVGDLGVTVTVGWDWQVIAGIAVLQRTRVGWPSSNIVVDAGDEAVNGATTPRLLAQFIDHFDWQSETFRQICLRYTHG